MSYCDANCNLGEKGGRASGHLSTQTGGPAETPGKSQEGIPSLQAWISPPEALSPPVVWAWKVPEMLNLRIELPEKNTSCSIKFEYQINNKQIFGYVSNIAWEVIKLKNYSLGI